MNLSDCVSAWMCCVLLSSVAAGCGDQASSPKVKIGVVNLETVIKESGKVEQFQQQAGAIGQGLQGEINQFQKGLDEELEQKVAEFGATPTDEQKKMLENMKSIRQNQLMQVNQRARMYMENLEQQMVAQFRQDIRPIVEKLSTEEKFDLIIEDTAFVIAYDKALDVSSKVAARLKMEQMNAPSTGQPAGMLPLGSASPASTPGAMAVDPLSSLLKSPSLPVPTMPIGSTAPMVTPKEVAPANDASGPPEAKPDETKPEAASEEVKPES